MISKTRPAGQAQTLPGLSHNEDNLNLKQDPNLNTALTLLRLGGECFQQHNLLSTASDLEQRQALERFFQWWNGRVVPFLKVI